MRFLHCADIHLDSPLRGLERYEGAPVAEVRAAPRRAFENLIALAERERVDFVLIAGDLFDGDWQDFNTGLFFVHAMTRLAEAGIGVYLIRGNHDAASRISHALRLPAGVHLLDARRPQSVVDEALGLAVHGQSFATAAVTEDLAGAYPRALPGRFNIGLLHTALGGRAGHAPYAPTSVEVLRSKGYDYWALGHVHSRELVAERPRIVFPGNIQGRHVRETGSKGCELVSVEDGQVAGTHVPLDVLRWHTGVIDIGGLADLDALLDAAAAAARAALAAADGRTLALRLQITGTGALQQVLAARPETARDQLRSAVLEATGGSAWVEQVQLQARPALDRERLAGADDALAELLGEFTRLGDDEPALHALAGSVLAELQRKLPPEVSEVEPDGLRLDDPATLRAILAEAEAELLARLAYSEPS